MVRSLQELCEVGVAVDICNDFEMKKIIFNISRKDFFNEKSKEVKIWQSDLFQKLSNISKNFPSFLLEGKKYIPLISVEIVKWSKFHREKFDLSFDFSKEFINNSKFQINGLIDRENAARALMEETSLSLLTKFKIASFYSFSDMIMKFWVQLTDSEINSIFLNEIEPCVKDMVKSWTDHLTGKDLKLVGRNNFTFNTLMTSIECSSDISFRNLWKKLKEEEKDDAVKSFMQKFLQKAETWKSTDKCINLQYSFEPYINMFLFMVEGLGNEKVVELFWKDDFIFEILKYLLHWPYQSSFFRTANLVWNVLPEKLFHSLLIEIIDKIDHVFLGNAYDYRLLFRKFWNASPYMFKRYLFINENKTRLETFHSGSNCLPVQMLHEMNLRTSNAYEIFVKLFSIPFTVEDEKNLCLIFESASQDELKFILEHRGIKILIKAVGNETYSCADLFLKCCKVENIKDFKINLVTSSKFEWTLQNLLDDFNYSSIDKILKWILGSNGMAVLKRKIALCVFRNSNSYLTFNSLIVNINSDDNDLGIDLDLNVHYFVQRLQCLLDLKKNDESSKLFDWICNSIEKVKIDLDSVD
ncbi:UNVERIFIED_CONTAM: hypothetical protein RMT77_014948 [Armadillidium vulgare]